ncbi:Thymidylate synthase 2 [compost metagenome]
MHPPISASAHPMQQFHDMLAHILKHGKRRPNRTGVDTLFVPGYHMRFDMADGFPAITTKKLAFKSAIGELVGFFRGYDSAAQFRSIGCKVWDGNANETKSWLANPARKGTDDLGRIYSKQWTDWRDWRSVESEADAQALQAKGYELIAHDTTRNVWVMRKGINQLERALEALLTNPTDRRILITAWRPDEFDQAALPCCHVDWNFLTDVESGTLHLCMYQRSFDSFLAYNVSMGGLFLEIMAKLAGLKAGTFNHFIGDAHIYVNHLEQVQLLLSREHRVQPTLKLGASIPTVRSVEDIPGVFARIQPEDIMLEGYDPHPAIPAPMAA